MSRSYKKIGCISDHHRIYTRWSKRQASKKARKHKGLSEGASYKKVYCSYDIFDYVFRCFDENDPWYDKAKRK